MIAALLEYVYNVQYFRYSVKKYYSNLKFGVLINNYDARCTRWVVKEAVKPIRSAVKLSASSGTLLAISS